MKALFLISVFCLSLGSALAQTEATPSDIPEESSVEEAPALRHTLSLEGLGRAGVLSLNYDYLLRQKFALGVGLGFYPGLGQVPLNIPVYANYYFPFGEWRPYLTASVEFQTNSTPGVGLGSWIGFVPGMGLEYRPSTAGGTLVRFAGYFIMSGIFNGWGGLSIGLVF